MILLIRYTDSWFEITNDSWDHRPNDIYYIVRYGRNGDYGITSISDYQSLIRLHALKSDPAYNSVVTALEAWNLNSGWGGMDIFNYLGSILIGATIT